MLIIKEREGSKYLHEEGEFEGSLWETILGCIIEDDIVVLVVGVAVLVAKGP